jgi:hypothetical protein
MRLKTTTVLTETISQALVLFDTKKNRTVNLQDHFDQKT